MNSSFRHRTALILAGAIATLLSSHSAKATSDTWNGSADSSWSTSGNWATNPATVPGTNDTATFNNHTAGASQTITTGAITIGTIVFDTANAAAYSLGGASAGTGTVTLNNGGAITMNSAVAADESINANLLLGTATTGSYTLTNSSTTNILTLAGTIQGGAGGTAGVKMLNITGAGSVILSGNITKGGGSGVVLTNTNTGMLTLSGAASSITTLNVNGGSGSIVNLGATGNLTINNGTGNAIQSTTGGTINNGTLTLGVSDGANGTADGTLLTIGSRITGAFRFKSFNSTNGTGVLQLTNTANDFSGGVLITSGVLSTSQIGNTGLASILGSGSTISMGNLTTTTGTLRYTGTGEVTDKVISLIGKTVGGTIDASNTAGLLRFTSDLTAPGTASTDNRKTLTLTGIGTGNGEFAGKIVDSILGTANLVATSVSKTGAGTWTLSGGNTYTGTTAVTLGTLNITGTLGNTAVTVSGGALSLQNASAVSQNLLTVGAGVLTETVSNAIGGTAALTINHAASAVTLSQANNFNGNTLLSAGGLTLSNTGAIASSALTLSGGTLNLRSDTNNDTFADTSTTISGSTAINVDKLSSGNGNTLKLGAVTLSAATSATLTVSNGSGYALALGAVTQSPVTATTFSVANSAPLTLASYTTNSNTPATPKLNFTGLGTATITGNITQNGSGALELDRSSAAGTLILQGTSNMTGAVVITNGTIQTGVATSAFGSTSGISIGASGTLALRGDASAAFSNGTTNYPVNLTGGGATINVNQAGSAAAGTTLALGTVAMNGAYTLNTTGANGVSLSLGAVTSSSTGTNKIAFNNSIAVAGTLTLASIAYTANTSSETVTFSGTGSTLVTGTISQNLTNAVAVAQQGSASGKTTLAGNSSYTGATTVSGGTLVAGASSLVSTNGAFGNASSAIVLGDAATATNNSSPSLLIGGAFEVSRAITIANQATSGIYTIGGNTADSSTFSGAIALNKDLTVTAAAGGTVNLTNSISNASGTHTLTKTGDGTLTLTGAQTYSTLTTMQGTTNMNSSFTGGTATVNAGARTNFGASQTLAALNIADGVAVTLGNGAAFAGGPGKLEGFSAPFAVPAGGLALGGSAGVPEPGSVGLLLVGALGLLVQRRRGGLSGGAKSPRFLVNG